MSASGRDWEPVVARLYRARHAVTQAQAELDAALLAVCEGEDDQDTLPMVNRARRRLDTAVGLLMELTRGRLS